MATAIRATKLTMMATTTTMATGDDDVDGDGVTGDDGVGRQRQLQRPALPPLRCPLTTDQQ
jgi:hypothetical protein